MHRSSHSLKLKMTSVNVKLPIKVCSWLRQCNLTSGIFSAHLSVSLCIFVGIEACKFYASNGRVEWPWDSTLFLLRLKLCGLINGTLMSYTSVAPVSCSFSRSNLVICRSVD